MQLLWLPGMSWLGHATVCQVCQNILRISPYKVSHSFSTIRKPVSGDCGNCLDLSQSSQPHDPHGSQGHTVRYCSHHSLLPKSTSNTSDAMHPSPSCLCWKSQGFTKASGHCHDIAPLPKQRAARRLLAVHGEAFARYAGYAASPISNVLAGRSWLGHLILRYVKLQLPK